MKAVNQKKNIRGLLELRGGAVLDHFESAIPLLYRQQQLLVFLNAEHRQHADIRNNGIKQSPFDIGNIVIVPKHVKSNILQRKVDGADTCFSQFPWISQITPFRNGLEFSVTVTTSKRRCQCLATRLRAPCCNVSSDKYPTRMIPCSRRRTLPCLLFGDCDLVKSTKTILRRP
jgi:hypothetical protein